MFASERCNQIIKILSKKNSVSVVELTELFAVSTETIRRDLCFLEKNNKLRRVHGGAISIERMDEYINLSARLDENVTQKKYISEIASSFIKNGDVVAIDSGSTAVELIKILIEKFTGLKIITYSLDIFELVKKTSSFKVILIGGQYMPNEQCFYGDLSTDTINNLHVKKAFICPTAISLESGAFEHLVEIASIQKAFMKNADIVISLADSSKFEKTALYKICGIDRFDVVITDKDIDQNIFERYKNNGINLINKE